MRKVVSLFLCAIFCLLLAGCGGSQSKSDTAGMSASDNVGMFDAENYNEQGTFDDASIPDSEGNVKQTSENISKNSRKLVTTYDLALETKDYDENVSWLWEYVSGCGGYQEYVDEDSYTDTARSLRADIRIPSGSVNDFLVELGERFNIMSRNVSTDDITLQYSDTEGHLASLRTEMERLNGLLAEAQDLEQILMLEDRIAQVRGDIESYERAIRGMDNQVDYTLVSVSVSEVVTYTEPSPIGWWDRAVEGIAENFRGVIVFFQELAMFVFVHIPQFAVVGVIVVIVLFLTRKSRRAARERRRENKRALEEYRAAQQSVQPGGPGKK